MNRTEQSSDITTCETLLNSFRRIGQSDNLIDFANGKTRIYKRDLNIFEEISVWTFLVRNFENRDCYSMINRILTPLSGLYDAEDYPIIDINSSNLINNITYVALNSNRGEEVLNLVLRAIRLGASTLDSIIDGMSIYQRLSMVSPMPTSFRAFVIKYNNDSDYRQRFEKISILANAPAFYENLLPTYEETLPPNPPTYRPPNKDNLNLDRLTVFVNTPRPISKGKKVVEQVYNENFGNININETSKPKICKILDGLYRNRLQDEGDIYRSKELLIQLINTTVNNTNTHLLNYIIQNDCLTLLKILIDAMITHHIILETKFDGYKQIPISQLYKLINSIPNDDDYSRMYKFLVINNIKNE